MLDNKRGQGLSTNAIILIVLGVLVLVVLIIGFTIGWDSIAPWLSQDNVDTIVDQCYTACSTSSVYDYCSKERGLKVGDLPPDAQGKAQKSVKANCTFFAADVDYEKYGIEVCPGLCS